MFPRPPSPLSYQPCFLHCCLKGHPWWQFRHFFHDAGLARRESRIHEHTLYPCPTFSSSLSILITNLRHSSRHACLGLNRCGTLFLWNLQSSGSCHSLVCHRCTGRKTKRKPKWLKLREPRQSQGVDIYQRHFDICSKKIGLSRVVVVIQNPT